ncbi:MAG: hypothetical protein ABFD50_11990 [Smithella sp.]
MFALRRTPAMIHLFYCVSSPFGAQEKCFQSMRIEAYLLAYAAVACPGEGRGGMKRNAASGHSYLYQAAFKA